MLEEPRIQKGPGLRGSIAFFVKRVIRRVTWWYVEPRFNEIRANFEDQKRTIVFLRKELDLTHREMTQLSLRLHKIEEEKKLAQ